MESESDHTLIGFLSDARKEAGAPSLRAIAAHTDYSHTTVARVFGADAPSVAWNIVEQVTSALGADTGTAKRLWTQSATAPGARSGRSQHPQARMLAIYGWCALLLTGGITIAMIQAVDRNVGHTTFVTDLVQLLFIAGATAAFVRRAVIAHRRADHRSRAFACWMAAGTSAWTVGQVVWFHAHSIAHEGLPVGHLFDIGYLLMPVCVGVALWMRAGQFGLATLNSWLPRVLSLVCVLAAGYCATVLMLCVLGRRIEGFALVAALYPATDLALAMLAAAPLVFGYRLVGSILLATGFLSAAASDVGYLLLTTDPSTEMIPAPAALGFIGFTVILSLYAFVARPLPARPRRVPRRKDSRWPRIVVDVTTAATAFVAVMCAGAVLWIGSGVAVKIVAYVVVVIVAGAIATRGVLTTATSSR